MRQQYNVLMDAGNAQVVQDFGDYSEASVDTFQTLHAKYMQYGAAQPFNYVPAVNDDGHLVMMKVTDANKPLAQDMVIQTAQKKDDGTPMTITVPAGTPYATYASTALQSQVDDLKSKRKINEAVQTGVKDKNLANANKFNAQAGAAASGAVSASGKDASGNWDPSSIPVKLVEGTMDPSQLTKRAKDYNATIQAADQYSQQKYGVPFNVAQAGIDYTYAKSKSTQDTLNYLNSLVGADGKSGNLSDLVAASNSIARTNFPALNDAAAWARLEAGDPAIAAYKATVTEVSDQIAKILQGGSGSGTSDAKLKQAADLFQTGFSTDQIKSVAGALQPLLSNRKNALIGSNRYLIQQYGKAAPVAVPAAAPIAHAVGEIKSYNGANYRFDGQQWRKQ